MSKFTILGADGFIGGSLVNHLRNIGHEVYGVRRQDTLPVAAGHVIYCIGLTADFRQRPFETVQAHVCALHDFLKAMRFDSFTYLSSTRVYQKVPDIAVAFEGVPLTVDPEDPSDLYNISKLQGESLCLHHPDDHVRVVRLSNVYGVKDRSENFLTSILRDALSSNQVRFLTPADAAKDYVALDDVLTALERVPKLASSRLINVASGKNVSNSEIAELARQSIGCSVSFEKSQSPAVIFPRISVQRLNDELGVFPKSLKENFSGLVEFHRKR